jgi:hypothetical protein
VLGGQFAEVGSRLGDLEDALGSCPRLHALTFRGTRCRAYQDVSRVRLLAFQELVDVLLIVGLQLGIGSRQQAAELRVLDYQIPDDPLLFATVLLGVSLVVRGHVLLPDHHISQTRLVAQLDDVEVRLL